jgi:Leucine-rich repeat (LRR) protein
MIPEELWELTELEILRLEDNQLSGTLSTGIGNLVHLEELRLSRTGLEGDLPTELANLQQLERANLEFNQFKGRIPNELCEVSTLKELTADCRGSKKVKCDCCTQCCDKKDDTCQDPDQTRNSMGNHRL